MSILDRDNLRLGYGIGIGVVAMLAAPVVVPAMAVVARPLVKELIKRSYFLFERSRERLALAAEGLEDLIAEVRMEIEQDLSKLHRASRAPAPADKVRPAASSRTTAGLGHAAEAREGAE